MPPFKSEAQRRKFHSLVKEGKMKQSTVDKFEKETTGKLPVRVQPKVRTRKTSKTNKVVR